MKSKAIADKILDHIRQGAFDNRKRLPSERALAQTFQVSRATVQAALASLEQTGHILRQPKRRPSVLSNSAALPPIKAQEKADQIAIWILPEQQDLGGMAILDGIRSEFGVSNYSLLMGCSPSARPADMRASQQEFFESISTNERIAGAIVWDTGSRECGEIYHKMIETSIPLVFIDREPVFPVATDVVATNNRSAARNAVRYLIGLGHQRIAMVIGSSSASSVHERISGYVSALREAELEESHSHLLKLDSNIFEDPERLYRDFLSAALEGPEPPTALFAENDMIALHLMDAARSLGIAIPGQLSIMGFDWLMRWVPSGGELTTVGQHFEEIGRVAAQRLLSRIASGDAEPPRHILLDAPLVIKNSTGAPMASKIASLASAGA